MYNRIVDKHLCVISWKGQKFRYFFFIATPGMKLMLVVYLLRV